jgi:DNA-binding NarL/FixJ family response regulator
MRLRAFPRTPTIPADPRGPETQAVRARMTEMRAQARRIAASTGQARLLRLLDQADAPPADGPDEQASRNGPDRAGLTPREIAVLRLLAAGSSNREIASRLKISENTAANHVRSILLKTGAANRTQVAMLAVSRGWIPAPVSAPPAKPRPAGSR